MPKIKQIIWRDSNDQSAVDVDCLPDTCPICHHAMMPSQIWAFCDTTKSLGNKCYGQVVYQCPRNDCKRVFIAYYKGRTQHLWELIELQPLTKKDEKFPDIITKLSASFEQIYNEAYAAEQSGLSQICGAGYRKALEFLLKDYLIELFPDKVEAIKDEQLGVCINNNVSNQNVKDVASRAAWLGNDETHYTRKWSNKDLTDLKRLIRLCVVWIEAEKLTAETVNEMSKKKAETKA